MALSTSYVAKTTQISFNGFILHLDWIRIDNGNQSGPGDVGMEAGAGVP